MCHDGSDDDDNNNNDDNDDDDNDEMKSRSFNATVVLNVTTTTTIMMMMMVIRSTSVSPTSFRHHARKIAIHQHLGRLFISVSHDVIPFPRRQNEQRGGRGTFLRGSHQQGPLSRGLERLIRRRRRHHRHHHHHHHHHTIVTLAIL